MADNKKSVKQIEKEQLNLLIEKSKELENIVLQIQPSEATNALLICVAEVKELIAHYKELLRLACVVCKYSYTESDYLKYKNLFYREYKKTFRDNDLT